MGTEVLGDRRKALEEAFFAKQDAKLRQELAEKEGLQARKAALAEVSGIGDDAVLERLIAMDIRPDTLAALTLVPLIEVAWADGNIDDNEQAAILQAASTTGLDKGSPSAQLLEAWLKQPPTPDVRRAWKDYVSALLATLDADAKSAFKDDILGRARSVAEAAGGFLGLGSKVSKSEQAVLEELEAVFE